MSRTFDIAVVGAAAPAAEALLELLQEREFPVGTLHALDAPEHAASEVAFGNRTLELRDVELFDFGSVELALFCGSDALSGAYAPHAAASGCTVVDAGSRFRLEADVPLVVPEVNAAALAGFAERGLVASPEPATVALAVALQPLQAAVGIARIDVTLCEPVSGAGKAAVEELGQQTAALLNFREIEVAALPRQIAFNVLPQVGALDADGHSATERALALEMQRVFGRESLAVNVTALRVPVFYGLGLAVRVQLEKPLSAESARKLLAGTPGIIVRDEPRDGGYPTAVTEGSGSDDVHIGRLRGDRSDARALNLWIVADNVRRGLAHNVVRIAEILVRDYL